MDWKRGFIELSENMKDNLGELKRICKEQKINNLYKYRSGSEFDIVNFNNNKLRMNCPLYYNDPFDAQVSVINKETFFNEYAAEHKESIKYLSDGFLERKMLWIYNSLYPGYESFLKDLQVCCFSSIKDSILMWSHYAKDHSGFCIEYDLDNLLDQSFPAKPVIYSKEMPLLSKELDNFMEGLYCKSEEWSYENEWRIVFTKEDVEFVKINPKAIYLGCKISDELKEILISICKTKEIECYQAKKSFFEYKLYFEKVC